MKSEIVRAPIDTKERIHVDKSLFICMYGLYKQIFRVSILSSGDEILQFWYCCSIVLQNHFFLY